MFANLFDKQSLAHAEIIKNGFCQAVEQYKNNPINRSSYATVLAFCDELSDVHYDEIIQENDKNRFVVQFIQELRKHHKNDSLNQVRKKLGNDTYLKNTVFFLDQKAKNMLAQSLKNLRLKQHL